jgi:7-cyano-7-deazaguanine synthase in queuosine biosynthesis
MKGRSEEHVETKAPVKLLWTGGWDSTFRLVWLVLVERRKVQPVYIIEFERRSSLKELGAMARIKEKMRKRTDDLAGLLAPTQVFLKSEIEPQPKITEKFKALSARFRVGSQFEWLSRFAENPEMTGIELAIEKNTFRPRDPVFEYLGRHLVKVNDCHRLMDPSLDLDLELFRHFRFPTYFKTKLEMGEEAKRANFYDILLESWFCHRPRRGRPCGTCNPCVDAMEEGFKFRLSPASRLRFFFHKRVQEAKRIIRPQKTTGR